jgi:hypothetical protein
VSDSLDTRHAGGLGRIRLLRLELLIEKEASKFSDEQIQVVEKVTITNPIHVTSQEAAKSVEKKTFKCWSTNYGNFKCRSNDQPNNFS